MKTPEDPVGPSESLEDLWCLEMRIQNLAFLQDSPVSSAESSSSSAAASASMMAMNRPMDLGMASVVKQDTSSSGSAPTSPKTSGLVSSMNAVQTHPLNLANVANLHRPSHYNVELLRTTSSTVNSRSLPNIPSAMGRPGGSGNAKVVGRRSPPAAVSSSAGGATAKQMLVRRSKSSAILPLRKHLIEKTMAEQQQKAAQAAAAAAHAALTVDQDKSLTAIRPIEEVMEEDMPSHHSRSNSDTMMEVDHVEPAVVRHFAARLGPSGLSPLVIGEVSNAKLTQEYLSKLLPNSTATTNFR